LRNLEKIGPRKREKHPQWHGGIQDSRADGYLVVNLPDNSPFINMATRGNRVFQHRLVVAESLGRCLLPNEVVHHLNGNRTDNRLENLVVCDSSTHEKGTLVKLLRKRIKELEEKL